MNYHSLMQDIQDNPGHYYMQPSTQTFLVASIAQNASAVAVSNIDTEALFIWEKTSYFVDVAGAAQTDSTRIIPLVTVQLTDSGSKRQLFDQPVPISAIAGHDGLPRLVEQPYLFRQNSNITANFLNYSGGGGITYANLYLVLGGYRVYEYSKAPGS